MTLVESITQNKADYNAAIDAAITQINTVRAATNTSFDATIMQVTAVAKDFPGTLIAQTPV